MSDGLFFEDDGRDWLADEMAGAPPRPAKGYGVYTFEWLGRVFPLALTTTHLVIALLVYSHCCRQRRRTVAISNRMLQPFGISRYAKYRALAWWQEWGVLTVETKNGQSMQVTLHWFP